MQSEFAIGETARRGKDSWMVRMHCRLPSDEFHNAAWARKGRMALIGHLQQKVK